jgi:hypothetical protein
LEKGTRLVKCPKCLPEVTRIRIRVTVAVYGKSVKIPCPKCLQDFWAEIPVPPLEPKQAREEFSFGDSLSPFNDPFNLFGDLFRPKR